MPDTAAPATAQTPASADGAAVAPAAAALPHLIRHGALHHDATQRFSADATEHAALFPPDEPDWIVPLETWLQRDVDAYAQRRHPVAILLSPDDTPDALFAQQDAATLQQQVPFIAIDFPAYTDGRGYSLAQLVRKQHGWTGELRAIGDVMIDTMHYMARCGFDSFLVKPSHDPHKALAALGTFSVQYQQSYPPVAPVVQPAATA